MIIYHEAVTYIRDRLCGAVVERLASVVEFRVQSFAGPIFTSPFFDIFFIYVILWHQWSITFIGKLVCHNSVLTYNFFIIEFGFLLFLVVQLIKIVRPRPTRNSLRYPRGTGVVVSMC